MMCIGIIFAVALVAIAAYYPIKLIKFYCMESKEQSFKNQIIKDLRVGNLSRNLIKIILGDGALRLRRSQVDVICEWMVQNTNAWRVSEDEAGTFVIFSHTPFNPEEWNNYEDYKHVLRQMFGDFGTKDFLNRRCTIHETANIQKRIKDLEAGDPGVKEGDFVRMYINDVATMGLVTSVIERASSAPEEVNKMYVIRPLSGDNRGEFTVTKPGEQIIKVDPKEAVKELIRQKEEWKNRKREEFKAAQRIEFRNKYGNITRGSYLKAPSVNGPSLYIVESVDMDEAKATAIRLVDLGLNFHAGEKCILPLQNGFVLVSPEEAAEILLKDYSNE